MWRVEFCVDFCELGPIPNRSSPVKPLAAIAEKYYEQHQQHRRP